MHSSAADSSNPSVVGQKPNIQTPMHGLFVPVWNNPQLNEAIKRAIKNPFAPIRMPYWSISVKLNNSPGTPNNIDPTNLNWATVMYKIPGYCPKNAQIFPRAPGTVVQRRRVVLVFVSRTIF